jgi:hypothetical protein
LRVIGNGAQFSISRGVIADSAFAVGADDFVEVHEFDGRAESVTYGAAEQASKKPALKTGIRWNSGKGHFSVALETLSPRTGYRGIRKTL